MILEQVVSRLDSAFDVAGSQLGPHRVPGAPPTEWTKVRIDLWALSGGKPEPIRGLGLRAENGGALFDQLVLGRTEADLP